MQDFFHQQYEAFFFLIARKLIWEFEKTARSTCSWASFAQPVWRSWRFGGFVFCIPQKLWLMCQLCWKFWIFCFRKRRSVIVYSLCGGFLKWWYPQNTPKWAFLVGKPMVVGYHHFRKPPYGTVYHLSFLPVYHSEVGRCENRSMKSKDLVIFGGPF